MLDQSNNKDPLSERTFPQKWVYPSDLTQNTRINAGLEVNPIRLGLNIRKKKHSVTVGKMNYSSKISETGR